MNASRKTMGKLIRPVTETLTPKETERLALELVTAAGEDGLEEDEAQKAIEELNTIAIQASLLQNWREGFLSAVWDKEDQELQWKVSPAGIAKVEDMMGDAPVDGNRRSNRRGK